MALIVLGILLVVSSAGALYIHQSCMSDADCTKPETYCYQSGNCVDCTNCSLYDRLPGSGCAKDKNKCGNCLPGMETEVNLDGTFTCNPSGTLTPSTQAPNSEEPNYMTISIVVGVIALVVIIAMGLCLYCIIKKSDTCCVRFIFKICPKNIFMSSGSGERTKCPENYEQPPVSQGPPPYEEANPSAPPFEDPPGGNRSPICRKVIETVANDPSQTANAYENPHYIRGGNLGSNPEPDDPEDDAAEDDALITSTISHPEDEETQPSTWTPSPGSETASTTGPTSFAGALSMDNLRITQPNPNVSLSVHQSNSNPNFNFDNPNPPENENSPDSATQVNINVNVVNLIRSSVSK